jgi:RNA polymerase sigma-B factor
LSVNGYENYETSQLIEIYKETGNLDVRNIVIERHYRLAESLAARFIGRGVDYDDLKQVALVALIGAIERFDPTKGYKLSTFATPTIIGEIKNYFRDKTRMMHISRRDSEQLMDFQEIKESLEKKGKMGVSDIAEAMGVSEERVLELMEIQRSVSVSSLDRAIFDDNSGTGLKDVLGVEDESFDQVELRSVLNDAMNLLDEKEKIILKMRFFEHRPQVDIARELDVSQMYISRAERRILKKLREYMDR